MNGNNMISRKCKQCHKDFIPIKNNSAIFCSVSCCGKNWRQKHKEYRNAYRKAWRREKGISEKGSPEHREKMSKKGLGKRNRWIRDRSLLAKRQERNDYSYQEWRKKVWERDRFLCKMRDVNCAGHIEAHHIIGWKKNPGLRYEVDNGITLCHFHHPRKRKEEERLSPYFKQLIQIKWQS